MVALDVLVFSIGLSFYVTLIFVFVGTKVLLHCFSLIVYFLLYISWHSIFGTDRCLNIVKQPARASLVGT